MICVLAALCLQTPIPPIPSGPRWPMVPGMQFAFDGTTGTERPSHLSISLKPSSAPKAASDWMEVTLPKGSGEWRTLQLVFSSSHDGTLAKFGGISLVVKNGRLWFAKQGHLSVIAPLVSDNLNDVQILKHFGGSVITYVNGSRPVASILTTAPLYPFFVGLDGWSGSIIGAAAYTRELSDDELFANEQAAKSMAKAMFADTPKVTVEGELTGMTPVPELERIRPYRSALLAEEYKVVRIVSGRMSAIKPGMKIRVFRYGIRAGEKTDVKNAKIGGHAKMLIQPYDSDPKFSREFQVDGLDPDFSIPVFVDVTPVN